MCPVLTYTSEADGQDVDDAATQLTEEEGAMLSTRPEPRMH